MRPSTLSSPRLPRSQRWPLELGYREIFWDFIVHFQHSREKGEKESGFFQRLYFLVSTEFKTFSVFIGCSTIVQFMGKMGIIKQASRRCGSPCLCMACHRSLPRERGLSADNVRLVSHFQLTQLFCDQRKPQSQRKNTVDPSSAPRICAVVNRTSVRPHFGHVSFVVASPLTLCFSTTWTEDNFWRNGEGKSVGLDSVTIVLVDAASIQRLVSIIYNTGE